MAEAAEPLDAKEIIRRMDRVLRGETAVGLYEMTITDPRWERTLKMRAWESRAGKKSFIRILSPPKEKGIGTLKIGNEMWNYLPKVERTIKIPPSMMMQPWMGSDFTNDDLVKETSIVDDYDHALVAKEEKNGFDAYHIEALAKPDAAVVWDSIHYWIRVDGYIPLRGEFYSEKGELIRVMSFSDVKRMDGRLIPTTQRMVPLKKKGRMTTFRIIEIEFDGDIPEGIFSLRNLKRVE